MDTNTTTATSNPAAIELIEGMIANNEASFALAEGNLTAALAVLEARIAATRTKLEQGWGIDRDWLREGAHHAEMAISQREACARERRALATVLKAAGGE